MTAELTTTDNLGVVPPARAAALAPLIDGGRPFLASVQRLDAPESGIGLTIPLLVTGAPADRQENEKDELSGTITEIEAATFDPTTIGGYGDISIQLLNRSDPSYFDLYLDLLGEAYGNDADAAAIAALLDAPGVQDGGTFDPADYEIGPAFQGAPYGFTPDRMWLSTAAAFAVVDAKAPGSNVPIYLDGLSGPIAGLRPVYVPALDDTDVDVIVGPSRGFGWAEDGTYTLRAVRPADAGEEVGLAGILWVAPKRPVAFTRYELAAS